jgi:toxin FitB
VIRYLLDTNIISEIHKPKPHGGVLAWFHSLREDQVFLSAVTLGELQNGIERVRKQDAEKAQAIEVWVDELEMSSMVLAADGRCFRKMARMMVGKQIDLFYDAMIATTASLYELTIASRNEKDFQQLGVEVFNPFKFKP